jgi:putative holliday junction resolvase
MARILSIDYGLKRTGLAITDPLQIIATGLTTVESSRLIPFLKEYFAKENVELMLIGDPKGLDNRETDATAPVRRVVEQLAKNFPSIPIQLIDERFSSKMASRAMLEMGLKMKKRRNKGLIDEIAATMILQEWLAGKSRGSDGEIA